MYAVGTLVGFPEYLPGLNVSAVPSNAKIPLDDALNNLKRAVSNRLLQIAFMNKIPVSHSFCFLAVHFFSKHKCFNLRARAMFFRMEMR